MKFEDYNEVLKYDVFTLKMKKKNGVKRAKDLKLTFDKDIVKLNKALYRYLCYHNTLYFSKSVAQKVTFVPKITNK